MKIDAITILLIANLIINIIALSLFWKHKPKGIPHKILMDKKKELTVDLTLMFGEGNEPTAQEFSAMYPQDYFVYDEYEKYTKSKKKTRSYTQTVKGNNNIQIMSTGGCND